MQPWHHVHPGDERVVEVCAERSLLLVWPTWNETWASDAVDGYHAAGGHCVVFVGEGPGGRTGDSGFHARLGETDVCIVCTYGVADTACTCGIDAYWTRTSRTTLPPWHGAETALHVYVPARATSEGPRGAGDGAIVEPRPERRPRFRALGGVERDEMRTVTRGLGVGVELHYVEVPTDELWRRIEARNSAPPWDNEPIGRSDVDEWLAIFQAPDAAELALFDPPRD